MGEEQIAAIVATQIKARLGDELPKALQAALAPQIEALKGAKVEEKPKDNDSRFAALEAELKKEREARASERRTSLEREAREQLRAELVGSAQVRPEFVEDLAALLFDARRVVTVGEDGKVAFKVGELDRGLKDGVAAWLKTPAAAAYIKPPAGSSGGSGVAPKRPIVAPEKETPEQRALRAFEKIEQRTGQRVF